MTLRSISFLSNVSVSALVFALLAAGQGVGCAADQSNVQSDDDDELLETTDEEHEADRAVRLAKEALSGNNFEEAGRLLEAVRRRYPFREAGKEAELRLGDLALAQDRYLEARERFRGFLRANPTHPLADEAAYKVVLSHVRAIPRDLFILPPSSEKDQTEVLAAERALRLFIAERAGSAFVDEAREELEQVRTRLARHELAVADFYESRERWTAVIGRLERVLSEYDGVGFDARVLWRLYEAHRELGDEGRGKEYLRQLVKQHPDTGEARKARGVLGS